jgi:ATP-dependent Zn protease
MKRASRPPSRYSDDAQTPARKAAWRTSVHEAGHAVIGRVLTLVCGYATIVADHDSAGHAICADPYETIHEWGRRGKVRFTPDAAMVGRVLVYMAGAEAERVLLGKVGRGDGEDRRQIAWMLYDIGPVNPDRYERRLRQMTRMLIHRHRERIERVAAALLARRTLSADALDALVGRSIADVTCNAPFLLAMHNADKAGRS